MFGRGLHAAMIVLVGLGAALATGCGAILPPDRRPIWTRRQSSAKRWPAPRSHAKPAGDTAAGKTGPAAQIFGGTASLKGRFVYDGSIPTATPLTITKDQEVCGKHDLVDESLVVAPDGSLANVVVWLEMKGIHAAEGKPDQKVVLDNLNCHFIPHVLAMEMGQTLEVKNSDPVAHNTKIDGQNLQVNPLIQAGTSFTQLVGARKACRPRCRAASTTG